MNIETIASVSKSNPGMNCSETVSNPDNDRTPIIAVPNALRNVLFTYIASNLALLMLYSYFRNT